MDKIALILTIIGGLNWGSIGMFRFDAVAWLFGGQTATVSRVIYTLVGREPLQNLTAPRFVCVQYVQKGVCVLGIVMKIKFALPFFKNPPIIRLKTVYCIQCTLLRNFHLRGHMKNEC